MLSWGLFPGRGALYGQTRQMRGTRPAKVSLHRVSVSTFQGRQQAQHRSLCQKKSGSSDLVVKAQGRELSQMAQDSDGNIPEVFMAPKRQKRTPKDLFCGTCSVFFETHIFPATRGQAFRRAAGPKKKIWAFMGQFAAENKV